MFGGFASKVYLNTKDDDNTIREAIVENYKIVANIPVATTGERVRYSINIFDAATNELMPNNEISLIIKAKLKRRYARRYTAQKYKEIATLNAETQSTRYKEKTFFYEYDKQRNYQLNFIINSIGGKKLETPLNVVTYHKVN